MEEINKPEAKALSVIESKEGKIEPEKIVVKAYDVASTYDLSSARKVLEAELRGNVLETNPLLVQLDTKRMVAVFDYGSIVLFNVDVDESELVMEKLKPFTQRLNKTMSEDEFMLYLAPRAKSPEGTDELYIKEFNRDIALVVGIVLSRSVSMEYYEKLVSNALAHLEEPIASLQYTGKIPRRERELTKRVGFALAVEQELTYLLAVFDDPDIVWDGGKRIEDLYENLKRQFDLEGRIKVIQQKVSLISRSSMFVISRLEAQRSRMLEWVIILLILFEIVLVILGKM
ncbi:MAG: RMD1 family protein [Ignavibacteriae bacterium]|nr:RMD1 family protein [Ignavibacteriota bacterium]